MSYFPSASATVQGAGTNYSLTTSSARIDFGTTDPLIVLPTSGEYLLAANVSYLFSTVALSAGDNTECFFRNVTDSIFVPAADLPTWANPSATLTIRGSTYMTALITITVSTTIELWAVNFNGARGVVEASLTSIKYIRLR